MKILVSVDIEGIAGVVHPDQTRARATRVRARRRADDGRGECRDRGRVRRAVPPTVLVNDSHGDFRNLLPDELDPRAEAAAGQAARSRHDGRRRSGCARRVFLVGLACAGVAAACSRTRSTASRSRACSVNGDEAGEAATLRRVAGEFGVPVALVTGDDAFVAETRRAVSRRRRRRREARARATGRRPACRRRRRCAAIEAGARTSRAAQPSTLQLRRSRRLLRCACEATSAASPISSRCCRSCSRVDAATLEFSSPTMRHAVRVLNSLSAMSFMLR